MISPNQQAIQMALAGKWSEAISINERILTEDPQDVDTLNRLAYAYSVIGRMKEAKKTYQKVLGIDKLNSIALRNLKRLSKTSSTNGKGMHVVQSSNMFLEETGKTKIIELLNIAPAQVVSVLRTGQYLQLSIKRLKIFVLNENKQYIGMLPEDIGKRLIKFMNGGNDYESYVKSSDERRVLIFIKEIKRANRYKDQPSFLVTHDVSHLTIEKPKERKESYSSSDEDES